MAIEAEDGEVSRIVIAGILIHVMNLHGFPTFATHAASAMLLKEHTCGDLSRNLCSLLWHVVESSQG